MRKYLKDSFWIFFLFFVFWGWGGWHSSVVIVIFHSASVDCAVCSGALSAHEITGDFSVTSDLRQATSCCGRTTLKTLRCFLSVLLVNGCFVGFCRYLKRWKLQSLCLWSHLPLGCRDCSSLFPGLWPCTSFQRPTWPAGKTVATKSQWK